MPSASAHPQVQAKQSLREHSLRHTYFYCIPSPVSQRYAPAIQYLSGLTRYFLTIQRRKGHFSDILFLYLKASLFLDNQHHLVSSGEDASSYLKGKKSPFFVLSPIFQKGPLRCKNLSSNSPMRELSVCRWCHAHSLAPSKFLSNFP